MTTDHELVLELCKRLNLSRREDADEAINPYRGTDNDYYADESRILIGRGEGFSGFYIVFNFTLDGNLVNHGVFE